MLVLLSALSLLYVDAFRLTVVRHLSAFESEVHDRARKFTVWIPDALLNARDMGFVAGSNKNLGFVIFRLY